MKKYLVSHPREDELVVKIHAFAVSEAMKMGMLPGNMVVALAEVTKQALKSATYAHETEKEKRCKD